MWSLIPMLMSLLVALASQAAEEPSPDPHTVRYRVTGLFQPNRTDDLKEDMKQIPEVTLVSVDYATAEAEFSFDVAKAFPKAKPDQWVVQFNNKLRSLPHGTFGVRTLCEIPREKLKRVEIPIAGLDCKGCSYGVYNMVYQLDGVEQATASFKDGLMTAWIDPDKTDREKLEALLKQRGVLPKSP
jgi:hypothetical protein